MYSIFIFIPITKLIISADKNIDKNIEIFVNSMLGFFFAGNFTGYFVVIYEELGKKLVSWSWSRLTCEKIFKQNSLAKVAVSLIPSFSPTIPELLLD